MHNSEKKKFNEEIINRKYRIIKFLYFIFFLPFFVGSIIQIVRTTYGYVTGESIGVDLLFQRLFILPTTIIILYIWKKLNVNNFSKAFVLLLFVLTSIGFSGLISTGGGIALPYLIFATLISTSSIILGNRNTAFYLGSLLVGFLLLYIFHFTETITYIPELSETNYAGMIIFSIFLIVIFNVSRLSHFEIEHSYAKAQDYMHRLISLNEDLETQVQERTAQLKKNFDLQADSVYTAAVIGSITQPVLHDIMSPVSSIKGALYLIKNENLNNEELAEVASTAELSILQLESVVKNARDLMSGKKIIRNFYPAKDIENSLRVIRDRLHKLEIKVVNDVPKSVRMTGVQSIFSRIMTNIIQNAIEELDRSDHAHKTIKISGYEDDKFLIIEIEDNGRGIEPAIIERIFEPNFSSKGDENMGFGLPFVRESMHKYFQGEVKVVSDVGKYTKFILQFKKENGKVRKSSKNKKKLKKQSD